MSSRKRRDAASASPSPSRVSSRQSLLKKAAEDVGSKTPALVSTKIEAKAATIPIEDIPMTKMVLKSASMPEKRSLPITIPSSTSPAAKPVGTPERMGLFESFLGGLTSPSASDYR